MSTRELGKADRRARIHAAARDLFAERGYDGTTIRAIAARAGVGTGTVLLYATSKADLLIALFADELARALDAQLDTLPEGALEDELAHLFRGFYARYAEQPAVFRAYIRETFALPATVDDPYDAISRTFVARLVARIEAHRAELRPDVDPTVTAFACFGVYLVLVSQYLRDPGPVDVAVATLRAMIGQLLRPLRLPQPVRPSLETPGG
ncbi:MAG: TetR/AcrR family transcriptional regulator [Myxococcota bacterium]